MRALPRFPACYRATLRFVDRSFRCLTHDLHREGIRLHFAGDMPRAATVGAVGIVRLDAYEFEDVELQCEVRHTTGRDIGLRFTRTDR